MKPAKVILLFCADEIRRSVLTCVLASKGYRILADISAYPPDMALLVDDAKMEGIVAAAILRKLHSDLPLLVIAGAFRRNSLCTELYPPGATMMHADHTTAELVQRIKLVLARKRGPKGERVKMAEVMA